MKFILNIKKICLLSLFLLSTMTSGSGQELHPAEKNKIAKAYGNRFETSIEFINDASSKIKIFWLDGNGDRVFNTEIASRQTQIIRSYLATPWLVTDERNNSLGLYYPDAQPRTIRIRESDIVKVRPDDDDEYDDSQASYETIPITICSNQPIPRGYLIIRVGSDFNCPNWSATGKNNYTIKHPGRTESLTVCAEQNMPPGFVITKASSDWNCSGWSATGTNAFTIKRPGETEEVCSYSKIPARYVVVSEGSSWNCPNWSATGRNTKRIKRLN